MACHMETIFFALINFIYIQSNIIFYPHLFLGTCPSICPFIIICHPWFIRSSSWCVWGTHHRLLSWTFTVLGFVTKAIEIVTYHGVEICINMANKVTFPTSNKKSHQSPHKLKLMLRKIWIQIPSINHHKKLEFHWQKKIPSIPIQA